MVSDCKEYEQRGYCIRGKECPHSHPDDLIELDVSGYKGLIEAQHDEQQNELKRKQADLLNNLVSQQRVFIRKIELCSDENEKVRLKAVLDEMSQKTKDWIEQEGARNKGVRRKFEDH